MRFPVVRGMALLALLPLLAACARGVAVESEPGPAYTLEVTNPMPHPMIVSYDDGTGVRLLGTVSANGSGRFVITTPASRSISVLATDEQRVHSVTKSVVLLPGQITEVVLGS
ncbi:MAG TPA: hypothetical protein VF188_00505 [Longimicrobiales bacterium]